MTLRLHFGKALQNLRKNRGLTQEDFSDVSSRTYLSTLERGLKSPTLEKIEQLAAVMQMHPMTLMALAYLYKDDCSVDQLINRIKSELQLKTADLISCG